MACLTKNFPFVEVSARSHFSFLQAASSPEEMVEQASLLNYQGLGLTDLHGVYGMVRAHQEAKKRGIPLLVGASFQEGVSVLVRSREGYRSLCQALSAFHNDSEDPLEFLFQKSGPKEVLVLLSAQHTPQKKIMQAFEVFGSSAYLVVTHHFNGKEVFHKARELEKKWKMNVIASNGALFHHPKRKHLHDVLKCIGNNTTLQEGGYQLLSNQEYYLRSKDLLYKTYERVPHWLTQTMEVLGKCDFSLDEIKYCYPREWIPEGMDSRSFLKQLVEQGAEKKYGRHLPPQVRKQIDRELHLVSELNYIDYFLTTWDIVRFAKERGILCQGRGSAANSILCYLLGITSIDPVRMDLLFERFISRQRLEPPDIDIDFEHQRREEVIDYLYRRYGRHRAALTATVITYRRKSALRDVGKVFGLPDRVIKETQKLTREKRTIEVDKAHLDQWESLYPRYRLYLQLARQILGFPRHLGTHVGGFVLCHEPLTSMIPTQKAGIKSRTIVQWDKDDLDAMGFVRVDILGLGILTAIQKSFELIQKKYGTSYTLASLPSEDEKVYQMCQKADTVGVFQIESRAQMNMLPRLKPTHFFDLVTEIALVRPGPLQGDMVHPYLKNRASGKKINYPHPQLERILSKTYGVPIFQEQMMKVATEVGGFSHQEADLLRRAMGTWRKDGTGKLDMLGEKLKKGLQQKGIHDSFCHKIIGQMKGFAEYGFPESHAASFAILAYATSYLKLYYPDAYLTALLNSQPMGFYNKHTLTEDAKRHGVKVLPVDVIKSLWENHLEEKGHVRLGLCEVKGLKKQIALEIISLSWSLEKKRSLKEWAFCLKQRCKAPFQLQKRDLFLLASADAFTSLGYSRREALWEIESFHLDEGFCLETIEEKSSLQKETPWEKIRFDHESCGVSLYGHPMSLFRTKLRAEGCWDSQKIQKMDFKGQPLITLAGMVVVRQKPPTAKGVLFVTLEDEFGFINLVVWKEKAKKFYSIIVDHSFLICRGRLQKATDGTVVHLIVHELAPLLSPTQDIVGVSTYDFH